VAHAHSVVAAAAAAAPDAGEAEAAVDRLFRCRKSRPSTSLRSSALSLRRSILGALPAGAWPLLLLVLLSMTRAVVHMLQRAADESL